ncbi:Valine N-monooxygenase 1 [Linum grandiflorum]
MNTSGGLSPDSITSSPATTTFVVLGLLALLISTTSIVFDVKKRRRQSSKPMAKLPPSPRSWPVIGNLPEVMRKKPVAFRWIHQVMKEMDTDICLIRLAGTNIIPVLDPAIAREMLKKQDELFAGRPFSVGSHAVSGGYKTTALVPYDDHWRKMRKVFASEILSPARHKWLHEKRAEEADNLVFYVNNHSGVHKSVNLRVVTQHYCGNLMRKIMFNKRFFGEPTADGGPGPKEVEHLEAVFETLKYVYTFSISNMLPFLRGKDRLVQESDIGGLNYVKACARESFRLHPLSPFNLPHVAGYFIPKGSYALLSRYGLGRNPKVWPDPLKFDPERHLHDPEVVLTEHELRFISFSTMMFARLIQCFSWAPSNGAKSIDSREAENELVLMSPLVVSATPRLAPHLYPNSV